MYVHVKLKFQQTIHTMYKWKHFHYHYIDAILVAKQERNMFTHSNWLRPLTVLQTKDTPEIQHQNQDNYCQEAAKNWQVQFFRILHQV